MRNLHCPFCGYWPIKEYAHLLCIDIYYTCPHCLAEVKMEVTKEGVSAMRFKSVSKIEEIRRG